MRSRVTDHIAEAKKYSRATQLVRRCAWLCAGLICAIPLHAQLHTLDASQYLHTAWTAQDGYFPSGLRAIAQTPDGYIWLANSSSLMRFDGVRAVIWHAPEGGVTLPSDITSLYVSKDGSLWVGGDGVAELRADGSLRRYQDLNHFQRARFAKGRNGTLWVAGEIPELGAKNVCQVSQQSVACLQYPDSPRGGLNTVFEDSRGRLWVSALDGIWRVRPGHAQRVFATDAQVAAFFEDTDGSILFAGGNQVRKLSPDGVVEPHPAMNDGKEIRSECILRDSAGGLWVGTKGEGIVHLHEGRIDRFSTEDGLSSDFTRQIFQDREGNVWALSSTSLDKFTRPAIPMLTHKQGLLSDVIYSILNDRDGGTWIGTSDGLNKLSNGELTESKAKLPAKAILTLFETSSKRLLVSADSSGDSSTVWVEGDRSKPFKTPLGADVFEITEDGHGDLWSTSNELHLLHMDGGGNLIERLGTDKVGFTPLSVMWDPTRGGIWLTSKSGELSLLKDGKITEQYGPAKQLGNRIIRALLVDPDGGVWISTQLGLAHLMNHKISMLNTKNGLPCNSVHWMRRDDLQNVWLHTECGLVSISSQDLVAWVSNSSHIVTVTHNFDVTEGVETLLGGGYYTPQSTVTPDGRILFVALNGMGILDPHNLPFNSLPPPVYIEQLFADGREINVRDHATVAANPGVIRAEFTALSFTAPRKVRFRYRLVGYDKDWSAPTAFREVIYTNLPPGPYRLEVVACNNDNVWDRQPAALSLIILPAWYQTIWFKVLLAIVVIGVLVYLYSRRIRSLEREMKYRFDERIAERMRIARELHDTLLQALQGVVLNFSNFTAQSAASTQQRDEMERSLDRAEHLMISGRERIRDLRETQVGNEDPVVAVNDIVNDVFPNDRSMIDIKVEGETKRLEPAVQDEMLSVVREALINARRHSDAKNIQVTLSFGGKEFEASVRDDGKGFDFDATSSHRGAHYGLLGMRERAAAIQGRLRVESSIAAGTVVRLSIPSRVAYPERREWWHNLTDKFRSSS